MQTGSLSNKPFVPPGATNQEGRETRFINEQGDAFVSREWPSVASELLNLGKGGHGRWPTYNNVAYCGLAPRLSLLLPHPVDVRKTCGGITKVHLDSGAKGIQVGRRSRLGVRRGGSPKEE